MKNINIAFLISLRLISAAVGFLGAVSFWRSLSRVYHAQLGWLRLIGQRINFGLGPSLLMLTVCLSVFAATIWFASERPAYPFRKVDYLYLLVSCCAAFAACANVVWQLVRWGGGSPFVTPLEPGSTWTNLIILPLIAYIFALLALGELVARLRDGTLFTTIYWVRFFGIYSIWRPVGFFAISLLGGQLILLMAFFTSPLVLIFSLASLGAFTFIAAHMLDLAAEYDRASVGKIQAERFKSELITNVSHDIKTPLTSIINYVDLLTTESLQGRAAEYVNVLVRKSSRLKTLIEDLMEASKAGTGNMRVEAQELNLAEIVGQVAGEFEDGFDERGLSLVIRQPQSAQEEYADIIANSNGEMPSAFPGEALTFSKREAPPSHMKVFADSRHLYRTLENLFSNVTKYAQEGTRVFAEITPMPYDGTVRFTLQNTSATPIELVGDALTEQFIRGDRARNTEGSGLGLYIAKSLVELMGGSLDIRVVGDLFWVEVVLCGADV